MTEIWWHGTKHAAAADYSMTITDSLDMQVCVSRIKLAKIKGNIKKIKTHSMESINLPARRKVIRQVSLGM